MNHLFLVAILNQEMSKTFLNTSKDEDKYKFFCKATLLENISRDYAVRSAS